MSVTDAINVESERMSIHGELPDVTRAMVALEQEIKVDPVLRELVKLRASILNGCAYYIDTHSKRARKPANPSSASTWLPPGKTRRSSVSASAPHWPSPMP
jgi:hypothetical protein